MNERNASSQNLKTVRNVIYDKNASEQSVNSAINGVCSVSSLSTGVAVLAILVSVIYTECV